VSANGWVGLRDSRHQKGNVFERIFFHNVYYKNFTKDGITFVGANAPWHRRGRVGVSQSHERMSRFQPITGDDESVSANQRRRCAGVSQSQERTSRGQPITGQVVTGSANHSREGGWIQSCIGGGFTNKWSGFRGRERKYLVWRGGRNFPQWSCVAIKTQRNCRYAIDLGYRV
jgi:hypothetical protein